LDIMGLSFRAFVAHLHLDLVCFRCLRIKHPFYWQCLQGWIPGPWLAFPRGGVAPP
jgi:hypothetical protein